MNARLHHNGRSQGCVGIDIGGTKIEGVLLDATDRVIDVCRMPSHSGESNVVTDIVRVARILSNEALPIGIGIPGQVNCATGQVSNVVNLDIETLELGERVSAIMHAPVHVENDVNAAAVGAAEFVEQVDGDATVVFLNFGTGLAAGLVRGGQAEHGYSGSIGEIGHLPIDPNGFECPCGQRGCLETVASGGAVAKLWPSANPPMPDLIRKARQGDGHANDVLAMVAHAMGDTIQIVAQAYDPQRIIIGGGMAKTGDALIEVIQAELSRRAEGCRFLTTLDIASNIRIAAIDQPIGAIGAALAAKRAQPQS